MKHILIILIVILVSSCQDKPKKNNNYHAENDVSEKPTIDSSYQVVKKPERKDSVLKSELLNVFAKAVQVFPKDSASLKRFYFKWNSSQDPTKIKKQIKRLEELTSEESIDRYRNIENNLKPLMTQIVNSNTISKLQSDSLVKLYSDYDYFSGESLFSQLLSDDENYNLVRPSMELMVRKSNTDTCFISNLILLNHNITTNVELAEKMEDYKVEAIRNNPLGFLEMYGQRQGDGRIEFANNISKWGDPDKKLIEKYTEISQSSANEDYRQLATEMVEQYKNQ